MLTRLLSSVKKIVTLTQCRKWSNCGQGVNASEPEKRSSHHTMRVAIARSTYLIESGKRQTGCISNGFGVAGLVRQSQLSRAGLFRQRSPRVWGRDRRRFKWLFAWLGGLDLINASLHVVKNIRCRDEKMEVKQ